MYRRSAPRSKARSLLAAGRAIHGRIGACWERRAVEGPCGVRVSTPRPSWRLRRRNPTRGARSPGLRPARPKDLRTGISPTVRHNGMPTLARRCEPLSATELQEKASQVPRLAHAAHDAKSCLPMLGYRLRGPGLLDGTGEGDLPTPVAPSTRSTCPGPTRYQREAGHGRVVGAVRRIRPALGIEVGEGLNRCLTGTKRVFERRVAPGSAAEQARLWDTCRPRKASICATSSSPSKAMDSVPKLLAYLDDFQVNDTAGLSVRRGDTTRETAAILRLGM